MKKLIPVILCCAMLLAACGSSADSAPAASESTSAAASSEAASSAESIIGGADGETDIVVSDEATPQTLMPLLPPSRLRTLSPTPVRWMAPPWRMS